METEGAREPRSFTAATIAYLTSLLLLSLFVNITENNTKDHFRMLGCVTVGVLPAVVALTFLWHYWKPEKNHFYFAFASILVFPLLFVGYYLMEFVTGLVSADGWRLNGWFWGNHPGLKHYVNNIFAAIYVTSFFSVPYFLSVAIVTETKIHPKKRFVASLWIVWLTGSFTLWIIAVGSSLN